MPCEVTEMYSLTRHLAQSYDGMVAKYWDLHSCILIMGDLRMDCLPCEVPLDNSI